MLVLKPGVDRVRFDELAFTPDGKRLVAPAWSDGVMVWSAFTNGAKAEMVQLPKRQKVECVRLAFAPDGTLYVGSYGLCAFDLDERTVERFSVGSSRLLGFGVSPDGSRLIVSENWEEEEDPQEEDPQEEDQRGEIGRLTAWAVGAHRKPVWEVRTHGVGWSRPFYPPAGDHFILCEYRDGPIQWDGYRVTRSLATGAELDVSAPLDVLPELAALSPDGRKLVCGMRERLRVYPGDGTWKNVPIIKNDNRKYFTGIAFHPSGKYLAATSNDRTVKLYDTTTWREARTFTWNIGKMRSICFSPDGTLAAAGSDSGKVVVWDVDF